MRNRLRIKLIFTVSLLIMAIFITITQVVLEKEVEYILVTGFEPFGGRSINSSWEAVSQLDDVVLADGREVVAIQLPVVWDAADGILFEAIDNFQPVLVINVGQGGGTIELEQYAHNYNSKMSDNLGISLPTSIISEAGPDVYTTILDIDRILNVLNELDINIPLRRSTSAGSYLCNFVSYNSYDYLAIHYPTTPTLFVHVPPVTDLVRQADKLSDIVLALEIIIGDASEQTSELILDEE
jgi:pyroglutamyl-peptidase